MITSRKRKAPGPLQEVQDTDGADRANASEEAQMLLEMITDEDKIGSEFSDTNLENCEATSRADSGTSANQADSNHHDDVTLMEQMESELLKLAQWSHEENDDIDIHSA